MFRHADDFFWRKSKLGVDKWRSIWYSNKAVGAVSAEESSEDRERKKGLTKTAKCGNLIKLLLQARRSQLKLLRRKHLTKSLECGKLKKLLLSETDREFKNFWKKFLTNEMKFAIIAMFRRIRRVPCKLNNVTKRKHQTEAVLMNRNQEVAWGRFSQLLPKVTIKMKLWQIAL